MKIKLEWRGRKIEVGDIVGIDAFTCMVCEIVAAYKIILCSLMSGKVIYQAKDIEDLNAEGHAILIAKSNEVEIRRVWK